MDSTLPLGEKLLAQRDQLHPLFLMAKEIGAGLLGEEYLSWNFAVLDVGGMNLFLRPPDKR